MWASVALRVPLEVEALAWLRPDVAVDRDGRALTFLELSWVLDDKLRRGRLLECLIRTF